MRDSSFDHSDATVWRLDEGFMQDIFLVYAIS